MEVDLSPEEYFRQQAAALLHSVEDPLDDNNNNKESWSEIDDNSGAEDNAAVLKRKRILRHGRMRLSEINERFSASKKKLVEARKHQLDLEMQQLKDGTHPQYKEFIEQVDARWSDRLAKIELEMESRRALAKVKLDSSRTSAKNTFIASKGEVRRAMVYRRKKQMWALTDNLRNLERIREAITNVAFPLSNQAGIKIPERGTKASNESDHLLSMPDTHLARIDEDADVSAVCGIPALLNYAETEMSAPEDSAAARIPTHNAAAAITEATDTRVPRSQVGYAHDDMGAAYGYQGVGAGHNVADETVLVGGTVATYEPAESTRDYGRAYAGQQAIPDARAAAYNAQGSRHGSVAAPVAVAVVASATASALTSTSVGVQPYATRNQTYYGDSAYQASYYDSSGHKAPNPRAPTMQHSPSVTATVTGVEKYAYGSKRHARINGATEEYQTPGYYCSNGTTTAPVAVSAQNGSVVTKHKYPAEFDEVPGKRQRTVHTSSTWPASQYYQQQQYQHQDARSWNEPVSATDKSGNPMVDSGATMHSYGYGRQAEYHQNYSSVDGDAASGNAYQTQYSHPPPPPLSGDQAYHYSQQQQQQHDYNRQGVSSSYYGSQKHDYSAESAAYYQQQQQAHYHSQDSGYYPPHYQQTAATNGATPLAAGSHHADAGYHAQHHYGQQHQHQQSAAAGVYAGGVQKTPADYHPQRHSHKQYASNSSYSGLDAGISMPAPSSSSNAWSSDYYSQQQPHHSSAQVYESQQHPHYRQQGPSSYHHQKHDSHSAMVVEYAGDPRAYYGGSQAMHQQQPQPQPQSRSGDPRAHGVPAMGAGAVPSYHHRQATTGGTDGHHYSSSSLTNILK